MSLSPLFIQSLEKGLLVLEAFAQHESMNLQEMSRTVGISTSSAQRVAYTLEQLGYITRQAGSKRYRLGIKAMSLGYSYLAKERLFRSAHAILHRLHQECGESVNFSVPDGGDMVFVMRLHTFKHVPIYMPIGARIPITASASGRAVLASLPADEAGRLLEHTPIVRHTPRTTMDVNRVRQIIDTAREEGFAYADEEFFAGDVNVAAAVLNEDHYPVAAVNISVPKPRWDVARARHELGPMVVRAARAISAG
ncbi:IclR family transcriptional regulator [Parapusillimonas sp. JC17]|uniref:IclR family transcriptional regulator n=1 Tax=Parapusillimonas sp. JC17 TaxID=3445768 RepID=UPI003FA04687